MSSSDDEINVVIPPELIETLEKSGFLDGRRKPKCVRSLTVCAYVLSVSMAAILLSVYYVFVWDGQPRIGARRVAPPLTPLSNFLENVSTPRTMIDVNGATIGENCTTAMRQPAVSATDLSEVVVSSSTTTIDNDNYTTMFDLDYEIIKPRISEIDGNNNHDDSNNIYNLSKSNFIKKLMMSFDDISSSNDDQYPYDDNK